MRQHQLLPALFVALVYHSCLCSAQNATQATAPSQNTRDALLQVNMRFLGPSVTPFTPQKQNAVIVGVANVLEDGILASDIILTVKSTSDNMTATAGRRKVLQQQTSFPGVDVELNITTSKSTAEDEAETLSKASNQTYHLASDIGAQGLQTQQIVLQSSQVTDLSQSPPPPPSPPPQSPPTPPTSPPPPSPTPTPPPPPTEPAAAPATEEPKPSTAPSTSPSTSGNASTNSGETQSKSGGSSFPTGAIIGIVAGVAVLAALIGFLLLWRKRRSKYEQQGEVIDYFTGLGKQGSREAVAGGLPVVASSSTEESRLNTEESQVNGTPSDHAAQTGLGSRKTTPRLHTLRTNEKAEVPITDKAEV